MKPLPLIILILISFVGYYGFFSRGLKDQQSHIEMTELGLMNYQNSGVVWYGCYAYFNDYPVLDLMYKTRDCKNIKNRGEFYPGHNKYDFLADTPKIIIGMIWKPNEIELKFLKNNYILTLYKNIKIWKKQKDYAN